MTNSINESEVYKWFDVFKENKHLTEVRIIGSNKVFSGYFKDAKTLVEAIRPYAGYNIYFTINRVKEECYGREQCNRIIQKPKNTTTDAEIEGRDWVFLDFDAKKIAGVNSTDEEVEFTKKKANDVYKFLLDNGFNKPIVVFSGNGVHFYLKCSLKPSAENDAIVKRFTMAMAMLYSDNNVDIDQKIFNLGRISKIPGTISRKGSGDNKERPQRYCYISKIPEEIKVNDIEYFKKIADLYPEEDVTPSIKNNYSTEKFDLDSFILKHGINVTGKEQVADGTKYYLSHCLFNEQHKGKDAILFQRSNGAVSYYCYHNSCSDNNWQKVRMMYEPDAYDKKPTPLDRIYKPLYKEKKEIKEQEEEDSKGAVWQDFSEIQDEDRSKIVCIPSGITQYDQKCCGFDKPSLSVWSGNNGSAKSTLLNQVALNAVDKGFKVAIYSGELRGTKLKRWILYQAAGKTYNRKSTLNTYAYYTPNNIKAKITEWLTGKLYNYNTKYSHNIEQVLLEVEKIVKDKDIDMLILDNLSCLDIDDLDGGINEQQKSAIKSVLRLTDKLGVATHIVVHPKKSENYLRKDDISGSKTITDLADCVFIVHRWDIDTKKAAKQFFDARRYNELDLSGASNLLEIVKQREFGEAIGDIYGLFYEPESRRLKNSIAEHICYGWEDPPKPQSLSFPEPTTWHNQESKDLGDIQKIYDEADGGLPFGESNEPCPF